MEVWQMKPHQPLERVVINDQKCDPVITGIILSREPFEGVFAYIVAVEECSEESNETVPVIDGEITYKFWDHEIVENRGKIEVAELLLHPHKKVRALYEEESKQQVKQQAAVDSMFE